MKNYSLRFKVKSNPNDPGFFTREAYFSSFEEILTFIQIHQQYHHYTDYAEIHDLNNQQVFYSINFNTSTKGKSNEVQFRSS